MTEKTGKKRKLKEQTMITIEEYRQYANSPHIKELVKWMVGIREKEDNGEQITPPKISQALGVRDFILFEMSFQELLRSGNAANLTIADWDKREPHEGLEDSMSMVNDIYKTSDHYGDKVGILSREIMKSAWGIMRHYRPGT